MNAQRNDHRDDMSAPHDAVANLVRATNEAMEALMKTEAKDDKEDGGVQLNPLMANPAVMMAAATAYGIRMTGQWATMFLNALQEQAAAAGAGASAGSPDAEAEPAGVVEVEPSEATGLTQPATEVAAPAAKPERKTVKVAKARKEAARKVSSPDGDDLKRISGIGPKLAEVLASRGLTTFAALAEMNEATLAELDVELGLEGRILRDDWSGQARKLMASRS